MTFVIVVCLVGFFLFVFFFLGGGGGKGVCLFVCFDLFCVYYVHIYPRVPADVHALLFVLLSFGCVSFCVFLFRFVF